LSGALGGQRYVTVDSLAVKEACLQKINEIVAGQSRFGNIQKTYKFTKNLVIENFVLSTGLTNTKQNHK
jgi:hypothetical protein